MASTPNKYTVHQRLTNAENRCAQLEAEVKDLRVHLAGRLETLVNDAKNTIQDSIRVPKDGKPGRDGVDGQSIVGPQGLRGDCNIPNADEVAAALLTIRKAHATFLAKILNDLDLIQGTSHNGMKRNLAEIRARIQKQIEVGGLA